MTLETLYYLSGIGTGIGVIISLVFVGIQIREQNRESRRNTMDSIINTMQTNTLELRNNPEAVKVYLKTRDSGFSDLNPEETQIGAFTYTSQFWVWEGAYFHHRENRLDERKWKSVDRFIAGMFISHIGMQELWVSRKALFTQEFGEYMLKHTKGRDIKEIPALMMQAKPKPADETAS